MVRDLCPVVYVPDLLTISSLLDLEAMNGAENEVVAAKGDEVMNADVVVLVQTDEGVVVQEEDQVGMMREETETEDEDLGVAVMIGLFN